MAQAFHKVTHFHLGRQDDDDTPRTNALMAEALQIHKEILLEYAKPAPDQKRILELNEQEYQKIREAERMEPKERGGTVAKMKRGELLEYIRKQIKKGNTNRSQWERETGWRRETFSRPIWRKAIQAAVRECGGAIQRGDKDIESGEFYPKV